MSDAATPGSLQATVDTIRRKARREFGPDPVEWGKTDLALALAIVWLDEVRAKYDREYEKSTPIQRRAMDLAKTMCARAGRDELERTQRLQLVTAPVDQHSPLPTTKIPGFDIHDSSRDAIIVQYLMPHAVPLWLNYVPQAQALLKSLHNTRRTANAT